MVITNQYLRSKPHLQVLLGWTGNEPQSLRTTAAPVTSEAIKSGMAITLDASGRWVKAQADTTSVVSFAFEDQDQADVVACGKLQGLSSLGVYRLQTGYFDNTAVYEPGSQLTVGADGVVTLREDPATPIVGYVVKVPFSLGPVVTSKSYKGPQDNSAVDLTVIEFDTAWVAPAIV